MKRCVWTATLAMLCLAAVLIAWCAQPAWASQGDPEETVRAHFAAIAAEDYSSADAYFSAAFLRAFKADVPSLNDYYLARKAQITEGYNVLEVTSLDDPGRETAMVMVEFGPYEIGEGYAFTEAMYYYLIREKAEPGAPLRDASGKAWRIDISENMRYGSLADARRRAYLNTSEYWDDDINREMRCRQGLYLIYFALEAFFEDNGQYPFRLLGGENRRDELVAGGYLKESYPTCGFADRPMDHFEFDRNHAGDFAYYSVDNDGDGKREGFWLLLHGKEQSGFYYQNHDIVYIINQDYEPDQRLLAEQFAKYWKNIDGSKPLILRNISWERGAAEKEEEEEPGAATEAAGAALTELGSAPPAEGESSEPAPAEPSAPETASSPVAAANFAHAALAERIASQVRLLAAALRPTPAPQPEAEPADALETHTYGL